MRLKRLDEISWDEFQQLDLVEKGPYCCQKNGMPYHTLIAQQFDRETLDNLCGLATRIRRIAKSKAGMEFLAQLLNHKRAMLDFSQPSSRTFLSFLAACHILGFHTSEIRNVQFSSEIKGESPEDSIRTFIIMAVILIFRPWGLLGKPE